MKRLVSVLTVMLLVLSLALSVGAADPNSSERQDTVTIQSVQVPLVGSAGEDGIVSVTVAEKDAISVIAKASNSNVTAVDFTPAVSQDKETSGVNVEITANVVKKAAESGLDVKVDTVTLPNSLVKTLVADNGKKADLAVQSESYSADAMPDVVTGAFESAGAKVTAETKGGSFEVKVNGESIAELPEPVEVSSPASADHVVGAEYTVYQLVNGEVVQLTGKCEVINGQKVIVFKTKMTGPYVFENADRADGGEKSKNTGAAQDRSTPAGLLLAASPLGLAVVLLKKKTF